MNIYIWQDVTVRKAGDYLVVLAPSKQEAIEYVVLEYPEQGNLRRQLEKSPCNSLPADQLMCIRINTRG